MKLALEDDEPTAISKVEFGMLFLALVLGAGSFSCHLTAADLGTQALDRSGYETWCFLLAWPLAQPSSRSVDLPGRGCCRARSRSASGGTGADPTGTAATATTATAVLSPTTASPATTRKMAAGTPMAAVATAATDSA